MQDLYSVKKKVAEMSQLTLRMWQRSYQAFMEHDLDIVASVLEDEARLNEMEKELTSSLINLHRSSIVKEEKDAALIYADVVGDLELIGDYCKDILERVQIKIEEKLLFSEQAVSEYAGLYQKSEKALADVVNSLSQDASGAVKDVVKDQNHIDTLVDDLRRRHNQRMIEGICSPFACNMFLNILDFTAAIYYHTKKIARNLQKIKR